MASMLMTEILPNEKKTVRLVFRHFPLSMHNWAVPAAQAAACAQEQGDEYFWRLHNFIFDEQYELTPANIGQRVIGEAKKFRGFDRSRFESCISTKKTASQIEDDIAFGTKIGVEGTPTLFVNSERVASAFAPSKFAH
jgi:protein-disulfide isomerase